jgi:hypothetical protein
MKLVENLEKLIRDSHILDINTSTEMDQRILHDTLKVQQELQQTKSAGTQPDIWRTIMKSPIIKLTAAVIIVIIGLGILTFIDTGSKSGVVWAEVAKKVQASRGVIFHSAEHIAPDTYDQENDFSMQYYTSTQSRLDGYKEGQIIKTIWGDCNTKTTILVDHYHKSYVKMTLEKIMPDRLLTSDPNKWVQKFLSCQYKKLGQKTIDGTLCEGIETTDPTFYGGGNPSEIRVARLWVSADTGYPVQFEGKRTYDGQRHTFVQNQFQWDVELDESVFEPNIPSGYIDISP